MSPAPFPSQEKYSHFQEANAVLGGNQVNPLKTRLYSLRGEIYSPALPDLSQSWDGLCSSSGVGAHMRPTDLSSVSVASEPERMEVSVPGGQDPHRLQWSQVFKQGMKWGPH
jgi:hypothetical protein